jgi:hypothetical protein
MSPEPFKDISGDFSPSRMVSQYAGFVDRLLFTSCDNALKAGRNESTFFVNGRKLCGDEMRAVVAYARRYGFVK